MFVRIEDNVVNINNVRRVCIERREEAGVATYLVTVHYLNGSYDTVVAFFTREEAEYALKGRKKQYD